MYGDRTLETVPPKVRFGPGKLLTGRTPWFFSSSEGTTPAGPAAPAAAPAAAPLHLCRCAMLACAIGRDASFFRPDALDRRRHTYDSSRLAAPRPRALSGVKTRLMSLQLDCLRLHGSYIAKNYNTA